MFRLNKQAKKLFQSRIPLDVSN